jgi:uncharacterized damage-inducible protein DinB
MILNKSLQHSTLQLASCIRALSADEYNAPLDIFSGATIGQHCRHIIEYFELLALGIEQGSVNYDNRDRDINLETIPDIAAERLDDAIEELRHADLHTTIDLIADFSRVGAGESELTSTIEREVMYCLEHAIHHMAIIKMGILSNFPDVELPADFGIAYSTIRHRAKSA